MKKLLTSLLGIGAIISASAAGAAPEMLQNITSKKAAKPEVERIIANAVTSTPHLTRVGENTYEFSYCAGIGTALGWQNAGAVLEAAIEIPTYMSKGWQGMKITKVLIGFGYSEDKTINLYVTDDLFGEPAYLQETTLEKDAITFLPSGQGQINQVWNEVTLETPYEIDGNPFYVGYQTVIQKGTCYPLCFDLIYSDTELGDYLIAPNPQTNAMEAYHMGTVYGNVCIKLVLEGDMPSEFDALPGTLFLESNTIGKNDRFDAGFTLLNIGKETITGLDLTCTIGGQEVKDLEYTIYGEEEGSIPFGVLGYVEVSGLPGDVSGLNLPLVITIDKLIGGTSGSDLGEELRIPITVTSKSYPRNVVVEEFTGTWCGFCPRGIVGMDYMKEKYADKGFIGICVHIDDPMQVDSYYDVIYYYSGDLPDASVNRMESIDPSTEELMDAYDSYVKMPAIVKIDLSALYDEEAKTLTATATSEFADNADATSFGYAFVITEDNVGPYTQTNYYAGGSYGDLPGWSNNKSKVSTYYEMVARDITTALGIEGSIPADITADTPYTYSTQLPLGNVKDINHCHVVAMVLDTYTGEIMNAAEVSLEGQAGIDGIISDQANDTLKVYNPQGIKVLETKDASELNTLPGGIYIVNGKKVAL